MSDGQLKGKVALITGAGRKAGLGQAIALQLANAGASIMLHDRGAVEGELAPAHGVGTQSQLEEIADLVRAGGSDVATVTGDLLDEAAIETIVLETVKRFGRLDILVNNAG
ncbi:MAG: SDR family NAD(P)-dependent oxidoreductase, partial [Rhizobium sp.]